MILVECVIGKPSFIQMKVSGGDPDEVQVNVKGEPITTFIVDNEYLVITGEAGENKVVSLTNNHLYNKYYKVTYFFH